MQIVGWQIDRFNSAIIAEDLVQMLFEHISAQTTNMNFR